MIEFFNKPRMINICFNPAMDIHIYLSDFYLGSERRAKDISSQLGGKGLNLARYFSALSQRAKHIISLPSNSKDLIVEQCRKYIGSVTFMETNAPLRQNYTLHEDSGRETRLIDDRFIWSENEFNKHCKQIVDIVRTNDLVIISGRFPSGVSEKLIMDFVSELNSLGAYLVIDSKSFTIDMLRKTKPLLIKPNYDEARELLKSEDKMLAPDKNKRNESEAKIEPELRDMVVNLIKYSGARNVLLSASEDGLLFCDGKEIFWARVPEIKVRSTIGAGDMSLAVFLSGMIQNSNQDKIGEILRRAAATATAYCQHVDDNLPSMLEISSILKGSTVVREPLINSIDKS